MTVLGAAAASTRAADANTDTRARATGQQYREAHATRSISVRIRWLAERERVHQFGCRHPHVERSAWHCKALIWTRRELREAIKERSRRDWDWRSWLPDKWARIGACETGYGKRPGNWHWDSGRYVSAFGIYRAAYAQYAHEIGLPGWDEPGVRTPREQYRVAMRIYHHYGLSGWGCRNA